MRVAATVVGIMPNEDYSDDAIRPIQERSSSDVTMQTLSDKNPNDESVAHLKLTRCRVRSEPVSNISGKEGCSETRAPIPRADSLLHLDSETVSTDLKKLLNVRVRQAPPSIDTGKANASGIASTANSPIKDGHRSSRLETEKSRPRVELYFGLNNHIAVEGSFIGGSLIVRVRKPRRGEARHIRMDGGKIRVLGYEGISESERYAFYQCTTSLVDAVGDHEQLYDSTSDSEGFRVAREGTFALEFKMHIPPSTEPRTGKNVPKGVIQDESTNSTIKYILLISFKIRDDSDNAAGLDKYASLTNAKTSIAHFYRYVEIWPTYRPLVLSSTEEVRSSVDHSGTVSSRAARELFLGGSGMLHLTAVLHRKVWLAGQKCMVYIGAWNETRKFIKTLSLAIIRKTTIARPNQIESINRKQIAEITLEAVRGPSFGAVTGKGWWAGVEPGSSCEFSHMIDIPIDALTIPRTHVVEISYVLRVSLVTGSLSPNVFVDLPFVIINAISTDGLPVPPPPGLLIGSLKLPKDTPVLFSFKAPRARDNKSIDLRTWSFPRSSPKETSLLPRDYILDWTRQTSAHALSNHEAEPNPSRSDFTQGPNSLATQSQASPRLYDTSTTLESVTNFITQLESDLDGVGHIVGADQEHRSVRFAHQSSEQSSGIFRHSQGALLDQTSISRELIEDTATHHSDVGGHTGLEQQTLVKKFKFRDDGPVLVNPDKDIWSSDDADAILSSIHPDSRGFSNYGSNDLDHSQEVVVKRSFPGACTTSASSSEPWSSEASTTDYQSSADQRSPYMKYLQRLGLNTAKDKASIPSIRGDTPRAGSIRRFQPEIVASAVQRLASRATIVPGITSPILAKSQSAHVVGSPINQYRRFVAQSFVIPSRDGDSAATQDRSQMFSKERRKLNAGHTPWRSQWNQNVTSTRLPSSYVDSDTQTSRIHLRTHSTPQPRDEQNVHTVPSQSTVRSRIAALEERSRGRPFSSYS
ncbi:hypothetical protein OPQ81_002901 [Rhizoctonia solani]|nr:hypothetical protein OPQ81_002901 [Rhizoctonia solani]